MTILNRIMNFHSSNGFAFFSSFFIFHPRLSLKCRSEIGMKIPCVAFVVRQCNWMNMRKFVFILLKFSRHTPSFTIIYIEHTQLQTTRRHHYTYHLDGISREAVVAASLVVLAFGTHLRFILSIHQHLVSYAMCKCMAFAHTHAVECSSAY